jgi:hypothetical protein
LRQTVKCAWRFRFLLDREPIHLNQIADKRVRGC